MLRSTIAEDTEGAEGSAGPRRHRGLLRYCCHDAGFGRGVHRGVPEEEERLARSYARYLTSARDDGRHEVAVAFPKPTELFPGTPPPFKGPSIKAGAGEDDGTALLGVVHMTTSCDLTQTVIDNTSKVTCIRGVSFVPELVSRKGGGNCHQALGALLYQTRKIL
jgi:hypothetical protein